MKNYRICTSDIFKLETEKVEELVRVGFFKKEKRVVDKYVYKYNIKEGDIFYIEDGVVFTKSFNNFIPNNKIDIKKSLENSSTFNKNTKIRGKISAEDFSKIPANVEIIDKFRIKSSKYVSSYEDGLIFTTRKVSNVTVYDDYLIIKGEYLDNIDFFDSYVTDKVFLN